MFWDRRGMETIEYILLALLVLVSLGIAVARVTIAAGNRGGEVRQSIQEAPAIPSWPSSP